MLPQCLAVGITAKEFWDSYPVEIEPYFEAEKIRRRISDEEAWLGGFYTLEAISVALGNAFQKKNTKPLEYRKQPILKELYEKNKPLTQKEIEEKAQQDADRLFHRLEIARFNQELAEKRMSGG